MGAGASSGRIRKGKKSSSASDAVSQTGTGRDGFSSRADDGKNVSGAEKTEALLGNGNSEVGEREIKTTMVSACIWFRCQKCRSV